MHPYNCDSLELSSSSAPNLNQPTDTEIAVLPLTSLTWDAVEFASSYDLELATDATFANLISSENDLTVTQFDPPILASETTYYWRIRTNNFCGQGDWSDSFSFTTANLLCGLFPAQTAGLNIGPGAGSMTTSTLDITATGTIADISLVDFLTNHTYIGDLTATLTSPSGTTIELFDRSNCTQAGMLASFADDAENSANAFDNDCIPGNGFAMNGEFQPAESFSAFLNEPVTGTWTLTITDNFNQDGGQLQGWNLAFCLNQEAVGTVEIDGAELNVFPNPTTGLLQINSSKDLTETLIAEVFMLNGQRVRSEQLPALAGTQMMDLSDLPAGAYFLRLVNGQETASMRIIKQ